MWIPKCNPCVAEYIDAKRKAALSDNPDAELPPIYDGITLAPQWQSQTTMGQMMFGVVAVPVCIEKHLAPIDPNGIQPADATILDQHRQHGRRR